MRIVAVEAESIGLPFAQAVISVTRACQSTKANAHQEEQAPKPGVRYFVTSLDSKERRPVEFARIIRSHWCIENKNHWKRDAQWREDTPRFHNPKSAQVLAVLRGAVLALCNEPCPILFARHSRKPASALRLINSPLQPLK